MPSIITRERRRALEACEAECGTLRARIVKLTEARDQQKTDSLQLGRMLGDRDEAHDGLEAQLRWANNMWRDSLRDQQRYRLAWQSARRRATWAHNEAATARSRRAVYKDLADTLTDKLNRARARIRELEATLRAMGRKLDEVTAANHAYDVPLLADPAGIADELAAPAGE